jgi:hypothetical protein
MYCECGCGRVTPVAAKTQSCIGHVKGQHVRFCKGHNRRKSGVDWIEVDHGYVTPCWDWQRSASWNGYGLCWDPVQKRDRPAHVIEWEKRNGPAPNGLESDHLCRNRLCVNPDHIEMVTRTVNTQRGDSTPLSEGDVREIRRRYDEAKKKWGLQSQLAREFGVTPQCIHLIVHRAHWRD